MTNSGRTVLYTGVTGNIEARVWQHKSKADPGSFTAKYNVNRLVWAEEFSSPEEAIACEKRIKSGSRNRKIALVEEQNPEWLDLYDPQ